MSKLTLGDFQFIELISRGSYGSVYKVARKADGRFYAIKQVDIKGMKKEQLDEVLMEPRMLSRLQNAYVIPYYDAFVEEGKLNMVMAHAANGNLHERIKKCRGKHLPEDTVWRYFLEALCGLHYIHAQKIIHRDMKSMNLFLDANDHVKVGDLGIAKELLDSDHTQTRIGTPAYLSPELLQGQRYNDKSDMWGLGVVLYELCALKLPFLAATEAGLIQCILSGKYTPITRGLYSPALVDIIALLLTRNPAKRASTSDILALPAVKKKLHELKMRNPLDPRKDPREGAAKGAGRGGGGREGGSEGAEVRSPAHDPRQQQQQQKQQRGDRQYLGRDLDDDDNGGGYGPGYGEGPSPQKLRPGRDEGRGEYNNQGYDDYNRGNAERDYDGRRQGPPRRSDSPPGPPGHWHNQQQQVFGKEAPGGQQQRRPGGPGGARQPSGGVADALARAEHRIGRRGNAFVLEVESSDEDEPETEPIGGRGPMGNVPMGRAHGNLGGSNQGVWNQGGSQGVYNQGGNQGVGGPAGVPQQQQPQQQHQGGGGGGGWQQGPRAPADAWGERDGKGFAAQPAGGHGRGGGNAGSGGGRLGARDGDWGDDGARGGDNGRGGGEYKVLGEGVDDRGGLRAGQDRGPAVGGALAGNEGQGPRRSKAGAASPPPVSAENLTAGGFFFGGSQRAATPVGVGGSRDSMRGAGRGGQRPKSAGRGPRRDEAAGDRGREGEAGGGAARGQGGRANLAEGARGPLLKGQRGQGIKGNSKAGGGGGRGGERKSEAGRGGSGSPPYYGDGGHRYDSGEREGAGYGGGHRVWRADDEPREGADARVRDGRDGEVRGRDGGPARDGGAAGPTRDGHGAYYGDDDDDAYRGDGGRNNEYRGGGNRGGDGPNQGKPGQSGGPANQGRANQGNVGRKQENRNDKAGNQEMIDNQDKANNKPRRVMSDDGHALDPSVLERALGLPVGRRAEPPGPAARGGGGYPIGGGGQGDGRAGGPPGPPSAGGGVSNAAGGGTGAGALKPQYCGKCGKTTMICAHKRPDRGGDTQGGFPKTTASWLGYGSAKELEPPQFARKRADDIFPQEGSYRSAPKQSMGPTGK
eukprot:jgi/Mesvir1/15037/Mv14689-RA.1